MLWLPAIGGKLAVLALPEGVNVPCMVELCPSTLWATSQGNHVAVVALVAQRRFCDLALPAEVGGQCAGEAWWL